MAIINAGEKSRHFGDDVIVIVMHVEVNLFVFFWTGINDFIPIFFGHDTDLVFAQVCLELFGLLNPARTERHAGVLMEFPSQSCLQGSIGLSYLTVARVVIDLGFGNHDSSRHA